MPIYDTTDMVKWSNMSKFEPTRPNTRVNIDPNFEEWNKIENEFLGNTSRARKPKRGRIPKSLNKMPKGGKAGIFIGLLALGATVVTSALNNTKCELLA